MNIAVVIYSWHLSRWRHSGLCLFLKGMHWSPICLNAFVRANHSWSSFIYRRSEYKCFFMHLCKLPFFLTCWLASSVAKVNSLSENGSSPHGREGRGQKSSLAFKGTCNKTARWKQSWFWQGKKGVVLHYLWEILTKVCYRLFIKGIIGCPFSTSW